MSAITDCVSAAYSVYLDRMDQTPAPMLADYHPLVDANLIQVATNGKGELLGASPTTSNEGLRSPTMLSTTAMSGSISQRSWQLGRFDGGGCGQAQFFDGGLPHFDFADFAGDRHGEPVDELEVLRHLEASYLAVAVVT